MYSFKNQNYEVWNILDVDDYGFTSEDNSPDNEAKKIKITEQTFNTIKKRIDDLVKRI